MNAPLYVTPTPLPGGMPPSNAEMADLLRQLLDVQREQVAILRAQQAANDNLSRWRAFLHRWAKEFPDVGGGCKQILPALERTYITVLQEVTERVREIGDDLEDEFVLGEFLDRYGIRVTQLGNIISSISPIADAVPPADGPTA
jgi:hypothetical protein